MLLQLPFFTIHANEFGINTNILETNLVNQVIILGVLLYVWENNFSLEIKKRKENIKNVLFDSQKKLVESNFKLNQIKKQLSQTYTIFTEIQNENNLIKLNYLKDDIEETNQNLKKIFLNSKQLLKNKERQILLKVKQKISISLLVIIIKQLEKINKINKGKALNIFYLQTTSNITDLKKFFIDKKI